MQVKGAEVLTHDNKPVAYASSPEELVCDLFLSFFFLALMKMDQTSNPLYAVLQVEVKIITTEEALIHVCSGELRLRS